MANGVCGSLTKGTVNVKLDIVYGPLCKESSPEGSVGSLKFCSDLECVHGMNFDQFCVPSMMDGVLERVQIFTLARSLKLSSCVSSTRERSLVHSFGEKCVDFGVPFNHPVYLVQRSVIKEHSTSTNQNYVYISANNKGKKA